MRLNVITEAAAKGYSIKGGEVYSLRGMISRRKNTNGYFVFSVKSAGRSWACCVHRLVAFQNFGHAIFAPGIVVRHLDGNKENNLPENIAIGTHSDNMMDKSKADRVKYAAAAAQKYPEATIRLWREEHAAGISYRKLQAKYGVSKSILSYYLSDKAKNRTLNHRRTPPLPCIQSPASSDSVL